MIRLLTFFFALLAVGWSLSVSAAEAAHSTHSFFCKGDVWVLSGDSITHNDFYRQTVKAALDHFHPGSGIKAMNTAVWGSSRPRRVDRVWRSIRRLSPSCSA